MFIKEFSEKTGLSKDTIRFYEKNGLLSTRKLQNGYHSYSDDLLGEIGLIQLGKTLGFSLKEIKELKGKMFNESLPPETIRKYMEVKLTEVETKIKQLQKVKKLISTKINNCKNNHCQKLKR